MIVATAELVPPARSGRAVLAFNVVTLEHAEAIAEGAERAGVPVILQVSENTVRYHGGRLGPIAAATAAVAAASTARLALHLDHAEDGELLRAADAAGFSSAMFDASALPYAANVAATAAAAEWAHSRGLWLEAELGRVGGKAGTPAGAHDAGVRTDPTEAAAFVAATGVDALAVAVGSQHAMSTREARLDHDLIGELSAALDVPLVLHGSSGVAEADLVRAIQAGMSKINVGTALNVAFTAALGETLAAAPRPDPRPYLAAGRAAIADLVAGLASLVAAAPGPAERRH